MGRANWYEERTETRTSRQRHARIHTRRGQMCSDLKSEMKIRRSKSRKFIRGTDRSGREKCETNDKVVLSRGRERCGDESCRIHTGQGQIRQDKKKGKHVEISAQYSYGAGTHGHIHTGQGRTGPLWTPSCNISVKEVNQNYPCLV